MAGSTFGNIFKITTWGESHGKALGAVIDGCPAGLPLSEEDIQKFLDRRKPGQSRYTTAFVQLIRILCLFHACDYPQFLPVSYPKLYHNQWHRP